MSDQKPCECIVFLNPGQHFGDCPRDESRKYSQPAEPEGSEPIDFEAANFYCEHVEAGPCDACPPHVENLARAYLALAAKLKERDEEIAQLLEACGDMELKRAIRARRKEAKR